MKRRDSLKYIVLGSAAASLPLQGCDPKEKEVAEVAPPEADEYTYGRTEKEKARDKRLMEETFFTEHEMATITAWAGLILPANESYGSAVDAGVPDFIEFIVKDMPQHQVPMRGGLMWMDHRANSLFEKEFVALTEAEQKQILDNIAFQNAEAPEELKPGMAFFRLVRNLTVTGYYTSEMGLKDLDFKGNVPNVWDGVPEEVLQQHGVAYDPEWLAKCVDQSKRGDIAQWDDEGNLIT